MAQQQAEIAHWFSINIASALSDKKKPSKSHPSKWMLTVSFAHTVTLYIMSVYKDRLEAGKKPVEAAWIYQVEERMMPSIDVDRECVTMFEQRLFESSIEADRAGSGIWGFDVGPLQNEWFPYNEVPAYWQESKFEDVQEDLEVGPNYKEE
ncbi:hypothetical protein BDQ17DRAFT_1432814 [Cyathus striatus]|nr:hypothetical protein BDQ17DRAFT_1432814 [Cyathus striatus]